MTGGFYYAPPESRSGDKIVLPPDESRHAVKVMRLSDGAEIQVVDGQGSWYLARIIDIRRGSVTAEVIKTKVNVGEPDYDLTLGVGLLKNMGRFETILEKAVELGVRVIQPLETERTQKLILNRNRCERVMIAGLKQCMRSRLPEIAEIRSFEAVVGEPAATGLRFIAHEGASSAMTLVSQLASIEGADRLALLIGPEGGFSDAEVKLAEESGWMNVSLGASRLRTETAAIAAAAVIHVIKTK